MTWDEKTIKKEKTMRASKKTLVIEKDKMLAAAKTSKQAKEAFKKLWPDEFPSEWKDMTGECTVETLSSVDGLVAMLKHNGICLAYIGQDGLSKNSPILDRYRPSISKKYRLVTSDSHAKWFRVEYLDN